MPIPNLNENYWKLRKLIEEAPPPRLLSIRDFWKEPEKLARQETVRVLREAIGKEASMLDIGAGDRSLEKTLNYAGWHGNYKSMDIDDQHPHDFHSLEEITGTYDCIIMSELLEHLDLRTGLTYLERAKGLLKKGGLLVVSVPNTTNMTAMWGEDITHTQPYSAKYLYGILRLIGFDGKIDCYQIHRKPATRHPNFLKHIIRELILPLRKILCIILGVSYAQGIMIIARLK